MIDTIFGTMIDLNPMAGSLSILIIVVAVICTEKVFEGLHEVTRDTPFSDMVSAIEKELMIVGSMAFIFKIVVNTTTFLDHSWLAALEYADLVVPITSFCLVGQGLFLILMSIKVCALWRKAYHLHLFELLEGYYDNLNFFNSGALSWLPFSVVNSAMEFRIFHFIFSDRYCIQRKSFAFDEYVQRCFEKVLLRIITIRPTDWFIVVAATMINWARCANNTDAHACKDFVDEEGYTECMITTQLQDFFILGMILFAILFFMAIISRMYELNLLRTIGIHSSDDYASYLQVLEEKESAFVERKRHDEDDLKSAIAAAKDLASIRKNGGWEMWYSDVKKSAHVVRKKLSSTNRVDSPQNDKVAGHDEKSFHQNLNREWVSGRGKFGGGIDGLDSPHVEHDEPKPLKSPANGKKTTSPHDSSEYDSKLDDEPEAPLSPLKRAFSKQRVLERR